MSVICLSLKSEVTNSIPIDTHPVTKMIDYTGYIYHCWSNGSRMLILGLAADAFHWFAIGSLRFLDIKMWSLALSSNKRCYDDYLLQKSQDLMYSVEITTTKVVIASAHMI